MHIYFLIPLLLSLIIGSFYVVHHKLPSKYQPLPIMTNLIFSAFFISLTLGILSFLGYSIPQISSEPSLKSINSTLSSFVLALILIELSNIKPDIKILKLASLSAVLPMIGAICFATFFGYINNIPLTVGLMCIFALSAVPVLFIYLKQINANNETIRLLMGAAILIDLFAWISFNFISTTFNPTAFILSILIAFTPFLIQKFAHNNRHLWLSLLSFIFIITFTSLFYIQSYALIFGILFLFNLQKTFPEGFKILPEHWIMNFFNYFAIPTLFVFSALTISWNKLDLNISIIEMIFLIFTPIILKLLGSFLGLKYIKYNGDKILGSILLNSRGLTEIVFINTLFMLNILSDIMYLSLLAMTFISTIAPGIIVKYQINKTSKKISHLVRVK